MSTSQNGWKVFDSGVDDDLVAIPKIAGRVREGSVATIFKDLVEHFDKFVEDVDEGKDEWGYAYRPVRGQSSGYSNHASGTAIDINAMQHPRGKVNTFSPAQREAIDKILSRYDGTVRWGGTYDLRYSKRDDMHFEINSSASDVDRVASKLSNGKVSVKPTGSVKPVEKEHTQKTEIVDSTLSKASTKRIQGYLRLTGDYTGILDGDYGNMTKDAVRKYQKRQRSNGMTQVGLADGIWGPMTQKYYEWVKKIQKYTNMWNASKRLGSLPEDGDYGSKTVRHVKAVQSANGKKPTGAYWKNGGRVADGIAGAIYCKTIGVSAKP